MIYVLLEELGIDEINIMKCSPFHFLLFLHSINSSGAQAHLSLSAKVHRKEQCRVISSPPKFKIEDNGVVIQFLFF